MLINNFGCNCIFVFKGCAKTDGSKQTLMVRNRHWRLISILIVLIDLKRDKTLNLVLFQIMRPAQSFKIRRYLAFDWPVLVLNGHKLCLSQMVTIMICHSFLKQDKIIKMIMV